ncbi:FtsK/SpoIIIE domain-containing protein [[Micrococcus luteus] ATCC 49442]|uniref:FtsK/SpoIIIE domain-containing protein n=1 Tax=[Micrococcus luteus] ATCC 49442 TaxID=2698727 RepID=UPI003D663A5A
MLLHCTLVRSLCAALQEPLVELTIDGPAGASGADLQESLAARFGTGKVSIEGHEVRSLTLGEPPLVNGAVLVDTPVVARRSRQRTPELPASLGLAVHSGAGAGLVVPLRRGSYTIGRSNADIVIRDADLSRAHALLVVTETAITIEDLDSANGTEVDGVRQRNAVITTSSTIRCGNSTMSLVFLEPGNHLDDAGTDVHEPLVVHRRDDPTNRAALLLTAVLPVIIGVGLAVVTGVWMFLAFTAVSAVSVLVQLVGGRRQRRDLAAAVGSAVMEDQKRRRRAAPPLSALTIGGATGMDLSSRATDKGIWLRLGQGIQTANLKFDPPYPGRAIPSGGLLPVTLDPGQLLTTIRGPRNAVEGLVRSLIMQIAAYPQGRGTSLVIHGPVDQLPLAARFLNGVTLSSRPYNTHDQIKRGHKPSYGHGVLILLNGQEDTEALMEVAREHRWQVINFPGGGEDQTPADVDLGVRSSCFRTAGETLMFVPDLAPVDVFTSFCRRRVRDKHTLGEALDGIPLSCRLNDLLPSSTAETTRRWMANRRQPGLPVPVGLGPEHPQMLDLQTDGPHLLVAGTTGAGKSELLRGLTIALALSYEPARINFLFVDFKGGSGLGPLTGLPHCAGMLTDLSNHELGRYLQSLRAEIRFREEVLAAVQAPDLASYRTTPEGQSLPLPHLVVVIDEFRMLVEDAPEALHELMRIAAIGRSLGIHLIMATQRPQGALTPDIRANVTTSIALRVQSEMESMDVINSKAAAGIRVDTPGRAYLARGTEAPVEFQASSLTAGAIASEPPELSIHLAADYIDALPETGENESVGLAPTPTLAATPLIASMAGLWESMNGAPVRKPVADPLPCILTHPSAMPDKCSGLPDGWKIRLGLMDLPWEQRTAPLVWEPAAHGHLGFVGGPQSGVADAIGLAVGGLATHRRESHLYILDPDSSFTVLESHGRVGSRAGLHELRRAVRILERLAQELSHRLAGPATITTPLVLVIAGWGSWTSAFRSGPLAWAEDLVHDLVRDGGRAGITVVISGQRELVTARFFAAIPSRVYFPTGSSEESRIGWPKVPATAPVVGRGVASGALSAGTTTVCQFYTGTGTQSVGMTSGQGESSSPVIRPFRVDPLPAVAPAEQILDTTPSPGGSIATRLPEGITGAMKHTTRRLWIGVGGDELKPVSIRIPAGGVLAVLGGPSSGKSSFLRLLPRLNPDAGPWLQPEPDIDSAAYWSEVLGQATAGSLHGGSVALVDNADLLPHDVNRNLADLNALGTTVVMTACYSQALAQRVLLALQARNLGTGLLIGPRTFLDGELFGVRFEVEPNPPPGRGILVQDGRPLAVQLGWAPPDDPLRRLQGWRQPTGPGCVADNTLVEEKNDGGQGRQEKGKSGHYNAAGKGGESDGQDEQLRYQGGGPCPPAPTKKEVRHRIEPDRESQQ